MTTRRLLPWVVLAALVVGLYVGLAACSSGAAEAARKGYPITAGEHTRQVCDALHLMSAKKPSKYLNKRFRVWTRPIPAKKPCRWTPLAGRRAVALKKLLGYPATVKVGRKTVNARRPIFGRDLRRILLGRVARPLEWVKRSNALAPPVRTGLLRGYPLGIKAQWWCGFPFQGTHRLGNWQSDNAVDLCVGGRAVPVLSPINGSVCRGYGFGSSGRGGRFFGERLHICDQAGRARFYLTHIKIARGVFRGKRVKQGDYLGNVVIGLFSPAHLHFGALYGFRVTRYLLEAERRR